MRYAQYWLTDGIDQFGQNYTAGFINCANYVPVAVLPENQAQIAIDDNIDISQYQVDVTQSPAAVVPIPSGS